MLVPMWSPHCSPTHSIARTLGRTRQSTPMFSPRAQRFASLPWFDFRWSGSRCPRGVDVPADLAGLTIATPQLGNTQDVAAVTGSPIRDSQPTSKVAETYRSSHSQTRTDSPRSGGRNRRCVGSRAVGFLIHQSWRARSAERSRPVGWRSVQPRPSSCAAPTSSISTPMP